MNKYIQNPFQRMQRNTLINKAAIVILCFAICLSAFYIILSLFGVKAQNQDIIDEIKKIDSTWDESQPVPLDKMEDALTDNFNWSAFVAAKEIYGGYMFHDIIEDYLVIDFPSSTNAGNKYFKQCISGLWSAVPVLTTLGIGLLCIWLFVDIIEKTTADSFTVEHFVKCLIKFVAGYVVLSNLITMDSNGNYNGLVPWIVDGVAGLSSQLISVQSNSGVMVDNELVVIWYKLMTYGKVEAIALYLGILLPSALAYIARLVIVANAIGRVIELAILVIFSPVGVSNLFGNGEQNLGVKYIKKVAAVSLQGIIMGYILYCGTQIQFAMNAANAIGLIAVTCVEATLITKSRNLANEIIGVH